MTSKPSMPESEGPRTETTLTTRIRINIPGSRPIPPVVVRKAMGDTPGTAAPAGAEPQPRPGAAPRPAPAPPLTQRPQPTRIEAEPEPAGAAGQGEGEDTGSNWFAPRKAAAAPPQAAAPTPPPAGPFPGAPGGPTPPAGTYPGAPGAPGASAPPQAGPFPGGPGRAPAAPQGGPFPGGTGAPGGPGLPGAPGGPGPSAPPQAGPFPGGPGGAAGTPDAGFAPPRATMPPAGPGPVQDATAPAPAGPGFGWPPPGFPAHGGGEGAGAATAATPAAGGADPDTTEFGVLSDPNTGAPTGPTAGPGFGPGPAMGTGAGPVGAVRTEEPPGWPGPAVDSAARTAPRPGTRPGPAPGQASPIRRVPAPGAEHPAPPRQESVPAPAPRPAPQPVRPAKKKGRSKVALLGGALVALLGVAYGAGLLLNHSDVPKGTTVFGVDISGSRDDAAAKLQTAFGTRATAPLQLSVGGKQVELKPEKAGLSLDGQTTVRNATGSDYNPVTVIGSLLGKERVADPVLPVDEEKLAVALQELAGTAGSATEGTITFDTGKAVAVPGTPGTTLDVDGSTAKVVQAFRDMVATGTAAVTELPVTTKAPVVDQAELDRAMKEFAEPAMSANAVVKVGGKSMAFGAKSLPKILSMQVVDGHLVEKYDLEALKQTYGNHFDGILITRGTGDRTAVTPQDIAGALTKALRGKTTAERTAVVETNAG
ncbi:hypothetical protein ACFWUQ_08100 [Streptomyces sp. NPDC058662]|uniref:hypothetical protein n=1 Tax=Streptomyces sp. NPDC058662 TaxID=3346583 RepID=UPI00366A0737